MSGCVLYSIALLSLQKILVPASLVGTVVVGHVVLALMDVTLVSCGPGPSMCHERPHIRLRVFQQEHVFKVFADSLLFSLSVVLTLLEDIG